MRKNGFIATSILYAFFLVFITLFVALITNYLHNQVLLSVIDNQAWETLLSINNKKFTDLVVGDHIKMANIKEDGRSYALNDDATWVVGYIETSGSTKTYYLLSDFKAQVPEVRRTIGNDTVPVHAVTIDIMNYLSNPKDINGNLVNDGYIDDLLFYTKGVTNGVFLSRDNFKVYIPRASILAKIRNSSIADNIKDEIFGLAAGDYAVYIDAPGYGGFSYPSYVLYRRYNFPLGFAQASLNGKYCSAVVNDKEVTYASYNSGANGFGYANIIKDVINIHGDSKTYINYCTYASPIGYVHNVVDAVVPSYENKINDIIAQTYSATDYQYRLMAEITFNGNPEKTYLAGGRGTAIDPYLITSGEKRS